MDMKILELLSERAVELNAASDPAILGPTYKSEREPNTSMRLVASKMLAGLDNVKVDLDANDILELSPVVDDLTSTSKQMESDGEAFDSDFTDNLPVLVENPIIDNNIIVQADGSEVVLADESTEVFEEVRDLLSVMNDREARRDRDAKVQKEDFGEINPALAEALAGFTDKLESSNSGNSGGGLLDMLFGGGALLGGKKLMDKIRGRNKPKVPNAAFEAAEEATKKSKWFNLFKSKKAIPDVLKSMPKGGGKFKLLASLVAGGAGLFGLNSLFGEDDSSPMNMLRMPYLGEDALTKDLLPTAQPLPSRVDSGNSPARAAIIEAISVRDIGTLSQLIKNPETRDMTIELIDSMLGGKEFIKTLSDSPEGSLENTQVTQNQETTGAEMAMQFAGGASILGLSAYEFSKDRKAAKAVLEEAPTKVKPALPKPNSVIKALPEAVPVKGGTAVTKAGTLLESASKAKGAVKGVAGGVSRGFSRAVPFLGTALTAYDAYSIATNDELSGREKAVELSGAAGGLGGSMAGAAAGALIGGPVGAIIGGLGGYYFGESGVESAVSWLLGGDEDEQELTAKDVQTEQDVPVSTTAEQAISADMLSQAVVPSPTSETEKILQRNIRDNVIRDPSIKPRPEKQYGFTPDADSIQGSKNFIPALMPMAEKAAAELGVDPKVLVAQAALETGWGKHVVSDEDGSSKNLFNIKANKSWEGDTTSLNAIEYDDKGNQYYEQSDFRSYNSYEQSFNDYVDFIKNNPRYKEALANSGNSEQYLQELQKAGYATDPDYANKIMRVMNNSNFSEYSPTEINQAGNTYIAKAESQVPGSTNKPTLNTLNQNSVSKDQIASVTKAKPKVKSTKSPADPKRAFARVTDLYTNDMSGYSNWVNDFGEVTDFDTYRQIYSDMESGKLTAFNGANYGLTTQTRSTDIIDNSNPAGDSIVTAGVERRDDEDDLSLRRHERVTANTSAPETKEVYQAKANNFVESQQLIMQKQTDDLVKSTQMAATNKRQPEKTKYPESKQNFSGTLKRGIDDAPIILADSGFTMLNVGYL